MVTLVRPHQWQGVILITDNVELSVISMTDGKQCVSFSVKSFEHIITPEKTLHLLFCFVHVTASFSEIEVGLHFCIDSFNL